jgi:protease PrsW
MDILSPLFYSLLGGILPAFLWLLFFLKEDSLHPEPKRMIFFSFLLGGVAVILVLPLQLFAQCMSFAPHSIENFFIFLEGCNLYAPSPLFIFAFIEEIMKFFIIALFILWRKKLVDEPIDMMVYLITIALGFAAFETALFLFEPLIRGAFLETILLMNMRFVGASLVHILASGVIGFFLALTFYSSFFMRFLALCIGLFTATILHWGFNHHILIRSGDNAVFVFFMLWIGVITLFLLFERAKRITKKKIQK